jgi:uncharacterized iron-regulated protein
MKRLLGVSLTLVLAISPAAGIAAGRPLIRLTDGASLPLDEIVPDLRAADAVFFGELHDQAGHHRSQLAVVGALHEAGVDLAIGLEMLQASSQPDLDRWTAGSLNEEAMRAVFARDWQRSGDDYWGILLYARDHRIPLVGLNIPREITRQVAVQGFQSLSPEQVSKIPGVRCEVDATYMEYIRRASGMRGHGGADFRFFCEAQMVWDSAMARNIVDWLRGHPATTMIVLAGIGHAWRHGIPARLGVISGYTSRVVIPEIPEVLERGSLSTADADYLWTGITVVPEAPSSEAIPPGR